MQLNLYKYLYTTYFKNVSRFKCKILIIYGVSYCYYSRLSLQDFHLNSRCNMTTLTNKVKFTTMTIYKYIISNNTKICDLYPNFHNSIFPTS